MSTNPCPHGDACLLLEADFDRDCKICRQCQQGTPEEYAIRVHYADRQAQVCSFYEIASPNLPPDITEISIYRLAKAPHYAKKVTSYRPHSPSVRQQINEQIAYYFTHG